MNLKAADGSAPIGFALVAPIGLLLLFASFDLAFLLWKQSIARAEIQSIVAEISRNPVQSNQIWEDWKSTNPKLLVSSNLQTKAFLGTDVHIATAKFKINSLTGWPITFVVRAERTAE